MGWHATIAPDMAIILEKGKTSGTIRPQLIHLLTGRPYVPICKSHPWRDSSSAVLFLLSYTHEFVRSWHFPRSILFPFFSQQLPLLSTFPFLSLFLRLPTSYQPFSSLFSIVPLHNSSPPIPATLNSLFSSLPFPHVQRPTHFSINIPPIHQFPLLRNPLEFP